MNGGIWTQTCRNYQLKKAEIGQCFYILMKAKCFWQPPGAGTDSLSQLRRKQSYQHLDIGLQVLRTMKE
jgi:hypothetical protein